MATLTKTYSGDLSSAIAGQIWEARQDAAAKRREALSEEFIGKEVDDHKLKRGEFFGHALAERATSWLPYMWQHRMPDFRANPDYLMRGQKRTIMSPFASPINPQPTGTRGGPNKPRGGIDPEIVPNDTILGKMINITPRNNTGGIVPKDGMVGRGGPIVKTRKDSIKVKDEKLGKFLTAVFMSLSASILSLNRKLDGNQDALIESKEGMFATQKALEDNSDMLGDKLDAIIAAIREQNDEIRKAEDRREAKQQEVAIEKEKDTSDTERFVKLSQDSEEVERLNQRDEQLKLMEEERQLELPINAGQDGKGYARGGIASGPDSGYLAVLHGDEAIVPLDNNVTQGQTPAEGTKSWVDMPHLERGNNPDGMKPQIKRLPSVFPKTSMVNNTLTTGGDDVTLETENLYKAMQMPVKASTIVTMELLSKVLSNSPIAGEVADELRQTFAPLAAAAGVDNTITRSIEKRSIFENNKTKNVFRKEEHTPFVKEERKWWNLFGRFKDWVTSDDEPEGGGPVPQGGGPVGGGGNIVNWWNKGRNVRVPGENTARWFGRNSLMADDMTQITRSNKAFSEGAKGLRGWNPIKAFTPEMVETGPTPAVRQAIERPVRAIRSLGSVKGGFLGLVLNELMNPASTAQYDQLHGPNAHYNNPSYDINRTLMNSPSFTGLKYNLVKSESEQNIFSKMEKRQTAFEIDPSIYSQDSTTSEEITEVSAFGVKGDPGLSTYYPSVY
tara:strand:- start:5234 stop:7420 length:2187 start_codon:yes stop_codon:yes gene_type:complete